MDLMQRFMSHVKKTNKCWLWTSTKVTDNYGAITIDYKMKRAHRVSYELFKGPIPEGMDVLHSCDNPPCVNPGHLRLGTHQENMKEKMLKGRCNPPVGERAGFAKLTWKTVEQIRKKYIPRSYSIRKLAKEYKVSTWTIKDILKNRVWKI